MIEFAGKTISRSAEFESFGKTLALQQSIC